MAVESVVSCCWAGAWTVVDELTWWVDDLSVAKCVGVVDAAATKA